MPKYNPSKTNSSPWLYVACYLILIFIVLSIWKESDRRDREKGAKTFKIEHTQRVFMHDQRHFSFILNDGTIKDFFNRDYSSPKIIKDVPMDKEIWVLYNGFGTLKEIHLHGYAEINGAGWDYGKNGHGQNVPLE